MKKCSICGKKHPDDTDRCRSCLDKRAAAYLKKVGGQLKMPRHRFEGKLFGDYKVLHGETKYTFPGGWHRKVWVCECRCGVREIIESRALVRVPYRVCKHVDKSAVNV